MILTRNINKKDFYTNFYRSLNFVLNLSNKELAILSILASTRASLPKDLGTIQIDAMTFSSVNRKLITQALGISIFNLNNYIKVLKRKGILLSDGGRHLTINPQIYVDVNDIDGIYSVEYKFKISDSK